MCRSLNDNAESQLAPIIFKNIVHTFNFVPELDIFASYLNAKVSCSVSWFPDPNAVANDTFSLSCENKKFYAFPPFSLTETTLAKIRRDRSTGIKIISKAKVIGMGKNEIMKISRMKYQKTSIISRMLISNATTLKLFTSTFLE